ncbi:uncharacterized protein [Macrobrachium rosenbergii]|uniref:uncharacterized protein isoform X5 n=1 Tax=Macrobrachium rosenbergii TaxID=79674 RepID=UPI0034D6589B
MRPPSQTDCPSQNLRYRPSVSSRYPLGPETAKIASISLYKGLAAVAVLLYRKAVDLRCLQILKNLVILDRWFAG